MSGTLRGIRVLDFSTLLPGPLATLLLADAGADVLKVERPGGGDPMRDYEPRFGDASSNFALLNRGKRSLTADLRDAEDRAHVRRLAESADVLVEQFRPGVMGRLGLGYEEISRANPALVYCSITSYGQSGERSLEAAHDLNFMAVTGALSLVQDSDGNPPPAMTPIGDIAGGSYPAVINVLLALWSARSTGRGVHLDVAMADNLLTLLYWALGEGWSTGRWPGPNEGLLVGQTPRYAIYRTSDDGFLAAAPLEDQFWATFSSLIGLERDLRDPSADPRAVRAGVQAAIARHSTRHWQEVFAGQDACCTVVRSVEEAAADPLFAARGLYDRTVADPSSSKTMRGLPSPVDMQLRDEDPSRPFPSYDRGRARTSWLPHDPESEDARP